MNAQTHVVDPDECVDVPGAASDVASTDLRRSALRFALLEGASSAAHAALTTGALLTGFLLLLGAGPRTFACVTAIAVLAQAAPLLVARHIAGSRKRLTWLSLTLSRVLWIPVIALFWMPATAWRTVMFVALYSLSRILDGIGQTTWMGWMASTVPGRLRGRYFARRNALQLGAGVLAGLCAAALIDRLGVSAASDTLVLVLALALAALSATWMALQPELPAGTRPPDRAAHALQSEPPDQANARVPRVTASRSTATAAASNGASRSGRSPANTDTQWRSRAARPVRWMPPAGPGLRCPHAADGDAGALLPPSVDECTPAAPASAVLRDRRFVRLLIFFGLWGLVNGVAAPFWYPFLLTRVGIGLAMVTIVGAAGSLVGALALPFWGRLCDRAGSRPVLIATIAWGSFHPLLYLLMGPGRLWPVWVDAISSGIVWNGFELAATNLLLALAPARGGEAYFGGLTAIRGIATALGSLAGGLLVAWLPVVTIAGLSLDAMPALFAATTLMRWLVLSTISLVDDAHRSHPSTTTASAHPVAMELATH